MFVTNGAPWKNQYGLNSYTTDIGTWSSVDLGLSALSSFSPATNAVVTSNRVYIWGTELVVGPYVATINSSGVVGSFASAGLSTLNYVTRCRIRVSDYVYIFGGMQYISGSYQSQPSIYRYAVDSSGVLGNPVWTGQSLPFYPSYEDCCFVSRGYIFYVKTTSTYRAKIYSDGSISSFTLYETHASVYILDGSPVVCGSKVHIVGCRDGSGNFGKVATATLGASGYKSAWAFGTDIPNVASRGEALCTNSRVFFIGGWDNSSGTTQEGLVVRYCSVDSSGVLGAWSTDSDLLPGIKYYHGGFITSSRVYLVGGFYPYGPTVYYSSFSGGANAYTGTYLGSDDILSYGVISEYEDYSLGYSVTTSMSFGVVEDYDEVYGEFLSSINAVTVEESEDIVSGYSVVYCLGYSDVYEPVDEVISSGSAFLLAVGETVEGEDSTYGEAELVDVTIYCDGSSEEYQDVVYGTWIDNEYVSGYVYDFVDPINGTARNPYVAFGTVIDYIDRLAAYSVNGEWIAVGAIDEQTDEAKGYALTPIKCDGLLHDATDESIGYATNLVTILSDGIVSGYLDTVESFGVCVGIGSGIVYEGLDSVSSEGAMPTYGFVVVSEEDIIYGRRASFDLSVDLEYTRCQGGLLPVVDSGVFTPERFSRCATSVENEQDPVQINPLTFSRCS